MGRGMQSPMPMQYPAPPPPAPVVRQAPPPPAPAPPPAAPPGPPPALVAMMQELERRKKDEADKAAAAKKKKAAAKKRREQESDDERSGDEDPRRPGPPPEAPPVRRLACVWPLNSRRVACRQTDRTRNAHPISSRAAQNRHVVLHLAMETVQPTRPGSRACRRTSIRTSPTSARNALSAVGAVRPARHRLAMRADRR